MGEKLTIMDILSFLALLIAGNFFLKKITFEIILLLTGRNLPGVFR